MVKWQMIFAWFFLGSYIINPTGDTHAGLFSHAPAPSAAIYTWQLVRWSDVQVLCLLEINHAGLPTSTEIYTQCGAERYQSWLNTPPCTTASNGGDTTICAGVYLRMISETYAEGETAEQSAIFSPQNHNLPTPQVWLNIEGCEFRSQSYHCSQFPKLVILAEEPLPNEQITQIAGDFAATSFFCEGARCEVELSITDPTGALMGFYAQSSSGMSSTPYQARVCVIQGETNWQVNVLSDRWNGESTSSCDAIWDAFPPLETLPNWLQSPQDVSGLASNTPYALLAGRLIIKGMVDARDCTGMGLEHNGYANACGIERARPDVDYWQNSFDTAIIAAAGEVNIPAQLLKNVFAQESQFWPGRYMLSMEERGLGQLTPEGADTLLLWNDALYQEICPTIFHLDTCQRSYSQLLEAEQELVRGAVVSQVDAECPECYLDLDLAHAQSSVNIFALAIEANCQQVGQMITNVRGVKAGQASSYEDLWRFTLVNYHAGAGCLSSVLGSIPTDQPLEWGGLQATFDEKCPGAREYVDQVIAKSN